jgi:hypothetical protein
MIMQAAGFEEIIHIQMSLQLAEHQLVHNPFQEQLNLSLSLVSIARGSCRMLIRPDGGTNTMPFGNLHIPEGRAVMSANISLDQIQFDDLAGKLRHSAPRPISLILTLDTALSVDHDGVLFVDPPLDANITGIAWTIPLK